MANALFDAFKSVQLGDNAVTGFAVADLEGDTLQAVLIDSADDTLNPQVDQDLADLLAAARVATAALSSVTVSVATGTLTFDAADTTFTAVSGDQSEHLAIYDDAGATEAAKLFVVFFDTFSSGMPVTPNGGDITVQWNASGIFTW